MLDLKLIRERPEVVGGNLARRNDPAALAKLEELQTVDQLWRLKSLELDKLRGERNRLAEDIGKVQRLRRDRTGEIEAGRPPAAPALQTLLDKSKRLPQELQALEAQVDGLRMQLEHLAMRLPNLLHDSVPVGKDDTENAVVRAWGRPRELPGAKSHDELAESLGLADFVHAAKVSGAGFVYLKGELVLLDMALQRFAVDFLIERGFTPVSTPVLMRRGPYEGVTDLADFEKVMYKVEGEDLYLIATSEHPLGAMVQGEILDEDTLPLKLAGVSPCFRREIGAHGVDTRGLFRMHQFNKVEQFVFCTPEQSWAIHEELLANAEGIFQKLGIPYRVVNVCTGDIGTVAAKKYDLEAWSPRQKKYVEVVSCSNCTDYQARRLKTRCGKQGGDKRVAHTLNSTAVATSRAMVVILENYQLPDGTVKVPEALHPYMKARTLRAPDKP